MSGRRKMGSLWRVTSLAVGKPAGNLRHVKAVIDRGGQIEILYTGVGMALARDAQGIIATLRAGRDRSLMYHLCRLDFALQISRNGGVPIDEVQKPGSFPSYEVDTVAALPHRPLLNLDSFVSRGGAIAIHSGGIVGVMPKPRKLVIVRTPVSPLVIEDFLRKIDSAFLLTESNDSRSGDCPAPTVKSKPR
jgi:hypothetical protein